MKITPTTLVKLNIKNIINQLKNKHKNNNNNKNNNNENFVKLLKQW